MKPIRLGLIGSGMMGQEHIMNLAHVGDATLTAIADPNEAMRHGAARLAGGAVATFESHAELLASGLCDAVLIAAPNHLHHRLISDTLDAGLHLLTEKPMCITAAECRDVIRRAEGSTTVNWVGLEYRYMPPVQAMLDRLAAGVVGDLRMVAIREHRFPFLEKVESWNRFSANTGGTLVEKCCHFFDLMNLLTGRRATRVMASGGQDVNHLDEVVNGRTPDILDNAFVIVDYGDEVRASLDLCMFAEGSHWQEELVVTGSEGKIEAFVPPAGAPHPGRLRVSTRVGGVVEDVEVTDPDIPYLGGHHGSSYREQVEFFAAIRNGTPALITLEDGLWSVAIGEAAHRSIDQGRVVEIGELIPAG